LQSTLCTLAICLNSSLLPPYLVAHGSQEEAHEDGADNGDDGAAMCEATSKGVAIEARRRYFRFSSSCRSTPALRL